MEFLWRYDGSYKFPSKKRFGFFPGISGGWRISEEAFWQPFKSIVSDLKFRASWGQTAWLDKAYFLPILRDEINKNKLLKQNPEY